MSALTILQYSTDGFITTELLRVGTAVEALHLGLYDHPALSETEYAPFLERVLEGVSDEAEQDRLKQRLPNTLSYGQRLNELAEKLDPDLLLRLVTNPDRWKSKVKKVRNLLSHPKSAELDMSLDLQFYLLRVTRAFIILVIAHELGLPLEALQRYLDTRRLSAEIREFSRLIA